LFLKDYFIVKALLLRLKDNAWATGCDIERLNGSDSIEDSIIEVKA